MDQNKKLKSELAKIEVSEKRIEKEEKQILSSEKKILDHTKDNPSDIFSLEPGVSKKELGLYRNLFIRKLAKRKFLYSLLFIMAVVLVWRGIWNTVDNIPFLNIAFVSLLVGIFIIWFLERYTDLG